jgi:Fe-S-cluster-containing dehydrogenase component
LWQRVGMTQVLRTTRCSSQTVYHVGLASKKLPALQGCPSEHALHPACKHCALPCCLLRGPVHASHRR